VHQNDVLMLGIGLTAPWKFLDQNLDMTTSPNELQLSAGTERGTEFQCSKCQKQCPTHVFESWRGISLLTSKEIIGEACVGKTGIRVACEKHQASSIKHQASSIK
jgi:hypothetical protein